MQIKKLIDVAEELKLATLKAKELKIDSYDEKEDAFNIYTDRVFKELLNNRQYEVEKTIFEKFPYEYTVVVSGLKFKNITDVLLFENDKDKLVEREEQ